MDLSKSLNCFLHHRLPAMFMIHGTEPINWVYEIRQRIDVFIKQRGDKLDAREIAFLEDKLFPVMDSFIELSAAIDEEREQQEQACIDNAHEERFATAN